MSSELSGVPGMRSVPLAPGAAVRPVEPSRALVPPLEGIESSSAGHDVPLGRSGVSALDLLLTSDLVVEREPVARTELEMGLEGARTALLRQQPGEALEALDTVWSRASQSEEGWYLRAGALVLLGQPAESDRVAGEGLERAPQSVALRFLQSVAKSLTGDLAGARAALIPTLETAPGHPVLVAQQVILQSRQGRGSATLDLLDRLVAAFPEHPATRWAQTEVRAIRAGLTRAASRAGNVTEWTASGPPEMTTAEVISTDRRPAERTSSAATPSGGSPSAAASPTAALPTATPPTATLPTATPSSGGRSTTESPPDATLAAPTSPSPQRAAATPSTPPTTHWFEPAPIPTRVRVSGEGATVGDGSPTPSADAAAPTPTASTPPNADIGGRSSGGSGESPNGRAGAAPRTATPAGAVAPESLLSVDVATAEEAFGRLGVRLGVAGTSDALESTRALLRHFSTGGSMAGTVLPDQAHSARTVLAAVVSALRNEPTTSGASPAVLVIRQVVQALRDGRAAELPRLLQREARAVPWPQRRWIDALLREVAPVVAGMSHATPRATRVETPTSTPVNAAMHTKSTADAASAAIGDARAASRTPRESAALAGYATILHEARSEGPELPVRLGLGLLTDSPAARQASAGDGAPSVPTVLTPADGRAVAALAGVQFTPGDAAPPLDIGTVLPPLLALAVALAAGINGAVSVAMLAFGAAIWLAVRRRTVSVTPVRRGHPGADSPDADGASGID